MAESAPHALPTSTATPSSLFSSSSTMPVPAIMDKRAVQWPSLWAFPTEGSPVSCLSSGGFAETESEEDDNDDYTAGLAEQIAHSMLQDDPDEGPEGPCATTAVKSDWVSQATFSCPSSRTFDCSKGAFNKCENKADYSSTSSSGVSSPSLSRLRSQMKEEEALQLLYEEFLQQKLEEMKAAAITKHPSLQQHSEFNLSYRHLSDPSQSLNLASIYDRSSKGWLDTGSKCGPSLKQTEESNKGANGNNISSIWPTKGRYQQACNNTQPINGDAWARYACDSSVASPSGMVNRSGMRAFFLGNSAGREPCGTGVFLPRRVGNKPDTRRKPGCSTVLLPSHIVKALNLSIEDTLACPVSALPASAASNERGSKPAPSAANTLTPNLIPDLNSSEWPPLQSHRQSQRQEVAPNVSLPLEWTY